MSKEALKLAILEYEKDLETDKNNQWVKNVLKGLKECEQDLERLEKLGKLEDIEEELGIDLIKAVELCKQVNNKKVVYTKENWGIVPLKILDELELELFSHRLYVNARGMYVSLDLYEYKKTWALTEEELENE